MTDATPPRAQKFAAIVVPAAERAGYTEYGAGSRLARDAGMSISSVSRMLKGESVPDMRFWAPLSDVLDFDLLDLLAEMGIPHEALRALSETNPSQVRSHSISPSEAADRLGITDPIGREMLAATIERLQRLEEQHDDAADQSGEGNGGAAAQR